MRGIVKRFPGVLANAGIDFTLQKGEIHALLGENGAGKTTLMKILYGLFLPDQGEIRIGGVPVTIDGPRRAIEAGIGMVHQHFMLIPPFTVAENIVLGVEPRRGPSYDRSKAAEAVREISARYGLFVDPDARVESISLGMQQRVEILKALYRQADVLILDEPTAVLTPQEVIELGGILRKLVAAGKSIVFITHKLREVMSFADRVTVLRRGERVGTLDRAGTGMEQLAAMMVGREVELEIKKEAARPGEVVLALQGVSAVNSRRLPALRRVDLQVRAGEILGIAGVEGNGQSELVEVVTGMRAPTAGSILLGGRRIDGLSPRAVHALGVAHLPEDRIRRGLVLDFTVAENLILTDYAFPPFARGPALVWREIDACAQRLMGEYDIRAPGPATPAAALSGGNQQKVVVARALHGRPRLVVAAQPTRGLDIGAIEFVHRRLLAERDRGAAVLLVSLELEELFALADRIAVMFEGEIAGVFDREAVDEYQMGLLMAGGRKAKGGQTA
ncbi:MAG: ABC transporter ATP-binding protein [Patescibacteria group bacterium]